VGEETLNMLLVAVKRVTLTHILLLAIVVCLFLNWQQLRMVNNYLRLTSGDFSNIESDLDNIHSDLTAPISVQVSH
jgi:hypothetical protein